MEEWEKTARSLPCGRTVRVSCCQKDRSQVISHTEKGYSTYCFRCGDDSRQFKGHGVRSASEMIQQRKELNAYIQERGEMTLPPDFTYNIPAIGRAWMLKYGVGHVLIEQYRIGWSPSLGRVVLPVWGLDGSLLAVQSRAVYHNQKPKYMNKTGGNFKVSMFWSDDATLLIEPRTGVVVLTEDILSTIRVGRLQHAVSSLGTALSDKAAAEILRNFSTVLVWYDGDEAGVKGAIKAKRVLELQGADVRIISTDKDPKEYNNEEIRRILND